MEKQQIYHKINRLISMGRMTFIDPHEATTYAQLLTNELGYCPLFFKEIFESRKISESDIEKLIEFRDSL